MWVCVLEGCPAGSASSGDAVPASHIPARQRTALRLQPVLRFPAWRRGLRSSPIPRRGTRCRGSQQAGGLLAVGGSGAQSRCDRPSRAGLGKSPVAPCLPEERPWGGGHLSGSGGAAVPCGGLATPPCGTSRLTTPVPDGRGCRHDRRCRKHFP